MQTTWHKRALSVFLTLVLAVALLAGLLLAAPVQARAAGEDGVSVSITVDGVAYNDSYSFFALVGEDVANRKDMRGQVVLRNHTSETVTVDMLSSVSFSSELPPGGYSGSYSVSVTIGPYSNADGGQIGIWHTGFPWYEEFRITATGPKNTSTLSIVSQVADTKPAADPSLDANGQAPDFETQAYYERHYNFWYSVIDQLYIQGKQDVVVDTYGQGIDHIDHFVFDALVGTSRTLTVKHNGSTYVIRGAAESANGTMRGILLGHNHSFDILGKFKV